MTVQDLKIEAKKKKDEGDFAEALDLYKQVWEQEKNEWNGYFLAQCFRKTENYIEARQLHTELERSYPNFKPLQNDKLWLDYSEKIKDWNNPDLVSDAESIIARADKYDQYTSSIYTKTVLNVVKHLCFERDYNLAYEWLLKLDQSVISNSVFNFQGQAYPADRKTYFIRYADVLISLNAHITYIDKCLITLNFKGSKHTQFKNYIVEDITFNDYISRVKLARHIKNFQEEFYLRKKKSPKITYNKDKITLISDLSHYLFCPVSFAINETYIVEANTSWEKDEWLGEKRLFIDRHKLFNKTKSFDETFNDSQIKVDSELIANFDYLLNSTIRVNNVTNPQPTIYSNKHNSLKGAPDYIMQDKNGSKYALTEKFSSIYSADSKVPFESDLVKHYAYLDELDKVNLDFGFFLTWYWELQDIETNNGNIKKKIVVSSYRLTKIERKESNSVKLQKAINSVVALKENRSMSIDGDKISYANKCFNCSVFSYCNHKTGRFDSIELPYNLGSNNIGDEPRIEFERQGVDSEEDDDFPF